MNKRDLITSSFGNILEWFDFGLFIYLAPVIGQQFFPIANPQTATIAAFGVFAAGFLLATLSALGLESFFPSSVIHTWMWRLPFILGGSLGFFIFYYRLQLLETRPYLFLKASNQVEKRPLLTALRYFPGKLLQIF